MFGWKLVVLPAVLAVTLNLPQPAMADTVQADQASQFIDSIGVAVHLNRDPYLTYWSAIKPLLTGLGVRHIRDGVYSSTADSEFVDLSLNHGIKSTLCLDYRTQGIVDPSLIPGWLTFLQNTTYSQYSNLTLLSSVETIEGPNEFDLNKPSGDANWVTELTNFQQALFTDVHGNSAFSAVSVMAPSMGRTTNQTSLPNMTAMVDYGNDHPYPGAGDIGYSTLDDYLTDSQTTWPSKPLQISEDGYDTNPNSGDSSAVTEAYQGNMEPHICLENFRRGVQRTFLYDLVDDGTATDTDGSHHLGLIEDDTTTFPVKPAYNSIKNMISVLGDGTNTFTPGALSFNVSGTTADVHTLLLEKKAGTYYLVLWVESTNQAASQPVTVTFDDAMSSSASTYNPCVSTTATAVTLTNNAINLTLTTQPTILKVTPSIPNGSLLIDSLASLSETTSFLNWQALSAPPANWLGHSTEAERTVATNNNNLVYGSVDIRGVTALIGFGWNTTNPDSVTYDFSKVQLFASPDNSTWTSVPTNVGEIDKSATFLAAASARWLVPVSAAGALPTGTNYVKFLINSTDGITLPQLFQMNVRQSGVEEAESMPVTVSGATTTTVSDANASGGKYIQLNATGTGQYMQFTTPSLPAGTYEYFVRFVKETNNGEVQCAIDGTNISGDFSEAGTAGAYQETGRAPITFTTAGTHTLRFTVVGTFSAGYTLNLDRVVFSQE
jgi:hypothetical protein